MLPRQMAPIWRARKLQDDEAAEAIMRQEVRCAETSRDGRLLYGVLVECIIVAAGRGMSALVRELLSRASVLHPTPDDDCSLVMASVALRLLRDWELASALLSDARAALARSSGELGWAYLQADGIEVATLAHMEGADDRLAQVLEGLCDGSRGRVRYEEHLVESLSLLAHQGRFIEFVRIVAVGVMADVTERARCGARFAPDEIDNVNELLRLCGATPSHVEIEGT